MTKGPKKDLKAKRERRAERKKAATAAAASAAAAGGGEVMSLDISTLADLEAQVAAPTPGLTQIRILSLPSAGQAAVYLRRIRHLPDSVLVINKERLYQVRIVYNRLTKRVIGKSITNLMEHPASPTGKASLIRQASKVQGSARMVGGDFYRRAQALARRIDLYAKLEGEPKNAPMLQELRIAINHFLVQEIMFE